MKKSLNCLWSLAFAISPALAGENFEGVVQSLRVDQVEITATEAVPNWLQQGQEVQAFGWPAQVHQVHGSVVTLKMGITRLKNVKVGNPVSIRAPASEEPQLCGA